MKHLLEKFIDKNENILEKQEYYLSELKERLRIKKDFSFSEEEFTEIEKKLIYSYTSGDLTKKDISDLFVGILIYTGEVYINTYGGQWSSFYDNKFQVHVPCIVNKTGEIRSDFISVLYDTLIQDIDEQELPLISPALSNIKKTKEYN